VNDAEWEELKRYVRAMADLLWLRDWTLIVSREEPGEDGWIACCEPITGRKAATLRFRNDFRERDPETQRQTVVHELLHCHTAQPWHLVRVTLPKELGQSAYNLFCDAFRNELEYAVDAIADAVSGSFPLIQWPLKEVEHGQAEQGDTGGSAPEGKQGPAAEVVAAEAHLRR
jgi:hypothetical protein